MKNITILCSLFILIFTSCNNAEAPSRENAFQNKTFVHLFFETEQECLEAQPEPDFFYNCHQQVNFLKDNQVELMLSDIIWLGEYHIERNLLILEFEPNFEIPDGTITFQILRSSELRKLDDNTHWEKMTGNSIWH